MLKLQIVLVVAMVFGTLLGAFSVAFKLGMDWGSKNAQLAQELVEAKAPKPTNIGNVVFEDLTVKFPYGSKFGAFSVTITPNSQSSSEQALEILNKINSAIEGK